MWEHDVILMKISRTLRKICSKTYSIVDEKGNSIGQLKLIKIVNYDVGRPDIIIKARLKLNVKNVLSLVTDIPILLIEVEKTGFKGAKEDFEQYFDENPLELKALIISSGLDRGSYPIFQYFNTKVMLRIDRLERPYIDN